MMRTGNEMDDETLTWGEIYGKTSAVGKNESYAKRELASIDG